MRKGDLRRRMQRRPELVKLAPLNRFAQMKNCVQRDSRFKLGSLVGAGSAGLVYQAMDLNTGEVVACKQLLLKFVPRERVEVWRFRVSS